jgi:hypothetical protein
MRGRFFGIFSIFALAACVPPAGPATRAGKPLGVATPSARAAKEPSGALRVLVPLAPRPPVAFSLFNGAFRSALESDGPIRESHDPAGLHATFAPSLPVPTMCAAYRDGNATFPSYLAGFIREIGQAQGRATVRVEPAREGVFFFLSIAVKPADEAPFVLSAAGVVGDRRSVHCVTLGGSAEGDLTRITRGLWDASQWAPAPDPEVTTSLHFYRVRDGAQTVGLAVRRTFQGTTNGENERGAQMFSFEFRGKDHEFNPTWQSAVERDDANGQPREVFYGGASGAAEGEYTSYQKKAGVWERQTGPKDVVALPGAPAFGIELGLRESVRAVAFTPDAVPFTYATYGYLLEENGKSLVKFGETKLSQVRPGILDEEFAGDHDRLEVDRDGIVVRETHFVKDGAPANDEHVREITERISHYTRAGTALVGVPE